METRVGVKLEVAEAGAAAGAMEKVAAATDKVAAAASRVKTLFGEAGAAAEKASQSAAKAAAGTATAAAKAGGSTHKEKEKEVTESGNRAGEAIGSLAGKFKGLLAAEAIARSFTAINTALREGVSQADGYWTSVGKVTAKFGEGIPIIGSVVSGISGLVTMFDDMADAASRAQFQSTVQTFGARSSIGAAESSGRMRSREALQATESAGWRARGTEQAMVATRKWEANRPGEFHTPAQEGAYDSGLGVIAARGEAFGAAGEVRSRRLDLANAQSQAGGTLRFLEGQRIPEQTTQVEAARKFVTTAENTGLGDKEVERRKEALQIKLAELHTLQVDRAGAANELYSAQKSLHESILNSEKARLGVAKAENDFHKANLASLQQERGLVRGSAESFGMMDQGQRVGLTSAFQRFKQGGLDVLSPEEKSQLSGFGLTQKAVSDAAANSASRDPAFQELLGATGRHGLGELDKQIGNLRQQINVTATVDENAIAEAIRQEMARFQGDTESFIKRTVDVEVGKIQGGLIQQRAALKAAGG